MLVKAGKIITGTGGSPLFQHCIHIEQGKITALGKPEDFSEDERKGMLDLSHLSILPGLIDPHVHLFLEGIAEPAERAKRWKEPGDKTFLHAVHNAQKAIQCGITTVRDLGGPYNIANRMKNAVEDGTMQGPRILTCGRAISCIKGHFHYAGGRQIDGVDDIRLAVEEQVANGADCIKLMVTGAVDFQLGHAGALELSLKRLQAAVQTAQQYKLQVSAHANGIEGVRVAIAAGVDSIEHGALLDVVTLGEIKDSEIWWVPTLSPFQQMLHYSQIYQIKTLPEQGIRKAYLQHRDILRRAICSDVKVIPGTDAGSLGVEHGELWRELVLLTELGMKPEQVLERATAAAARMLGIGHEAGTIEPGKNADIIGVEGNPLVEVSCLRNVQIVIRNGHVICRKGRNDALPSLQLTQLRVDSSGTGDTIYKGG